MTNYMPLPYTYNGEYSTGNNDPSSISKNLPVSPPLQQGLMSISQPSTPRPEDNKILGSPPSDIKPTSSSSPNLIRKRPSIPSRPANFTTTFHSNPYPSAGPVRRRRTESIFSFEMGPTFSSTKQLHELCNMDQSNNYQVQLHAKMDRGFFRADQDWTCYRRNYFQVSSTFDVHGMNYMIQGPELPCLLKKSDMQEFLQVDYFSIGVCARVANHDKKIELVQHTPKRDKGPQIVPGPRPVRSGGNLHLASVGANNNIVTFERLQFKTATANNGKRRAAQQYYEIVVELYANFTNAEPLRVATCTSAALVVRGRSPGHYADSHTRFKNMDGEPSIGHENEPVVETVEKFSGSSVTANGVIDQHHSPNHRYTSLPTSPNSDLGPYSPYNPYPYSSLPNYPPTMNPPPPGLAQYATHHQSNNQPVHYYQNDPSHPPPPPHLYGGSYEDPKGLKSGLKATGYWNNDIQRHHHQEPSQYNHHGPMYMNDPYARHGEEPYGLDAGRPHQ